MTRRLVSIGFFRGLFIFPGELFEAARGGSARWKKLRLPATERTEIGVPLPETDGEAFSQLRFALPAGRVEQGLCTLPVRRRGLLRVLPTNALSGE